MYMYVELCYIKKKGGVSGIGDYSDGYAQGGTLKFSVYISEADFLGVKILNFRVLGGFQKN